MASRSPRGQWINIILSTGMGMQCRSSRFIEYPPGGSHTDGHPVEKAGTKVSTVWCRYNAVNFLQNHHNRHPIAGPWGRGMGCLLWLWNLICVLLLPLQYPMWYRDKLDRVITALHCSIIMIMYKLLRRLLTHCGLVMHNDDRDLSQPAQVIACCLTTPSHYLNQY